MSEKSRKYYAKHKERIKASSNKYQREHVVRAGASDRSHTRMKGSACESLVDTRLSWSGIECYGPQFMNGRHDRVIYADERFWTVQVKLGELNTNTGNLTFGKREKVKSELVALVWPPTQYIYWIAYRCAALPKLLIDWFGPVFGWSRKKLPAVADRQDRWEQPLLCTPGISLEEVAVDLCAQAESQPPRPSENHQPADEKRSDTDVRQPDPLAVSHEDFSEYPLRPSVKSFQLSALRRQPPYQSLSTPVCFQDQLPFDGALAAQA